VPSVRTFVAIELKPGILDALEEVQEQLRRGEGGRAGRWVRRDSHHLTLKFLGEVPVKQLESIYEAVERACEGCHPFVLTMRSLECLPNPRRARVICMGVQDETGQLLAVQGSVERELSRLGFPEERRRFRPHLTLARIRRRAARWEVEALVGSVAKYEVAERACMRVSEVSVVRSDLRPEGPVYTQLFQAPLTGGEGH